MANSQLFQTILGIAKETTYGTFVAPTTLIPIEQPDFQPQDLRHIMDTGYRGLAALEYDILPGPGEGKFSFNGNVFTDSFPNFVMNLLGTDTITGAGPYVHTFKMNAAPPSHSLEWYANSSAAYDFKGSRLSSLQVNFNAKDGALTYTAQGQSKLGVFQASPTTSGLSISAVQSAAAWLGTITVAGGAPASLLEGSLTIRRALKPLHALNATQDIASLYPLPLEVEGRLTFDFTGVTEYNYYASTSGTKNAVVLNFVQTATTAELKFTCTNAAWKMAKPTASDGIYTAVATFKGLYSATDNGPIAVVAKNNITPAY